MIVLAAPPTVETAGLLDPENPWPGLASYDERSHRFFSGRAAEADELVRRIIDEPIAVLFGKSGLGKTSLLHAGVFPRLRRHDLLPVVVRLQVRDSTTPFIDQVKQRLLEELQAHGIEHAGTSDTEPLWDYLHRIGQEFWSRQNRLVRPVFVLDQFEELFTLGRAAAAAVNAFREDLADLAENRIPADLARRHADAPGDLDVNPRAMPYKIVIALREDFLADLESWRAMMPSLRSNRMRLLPMRPDRALEAVCNERTSHLVSEPVGRAIVAFLSSRGSHEGAAGTCAGTPAVEPALLSLFCSGVNEQRKRAGKTRLDSELVEGAKGTIVKDFYLASLADQRARVRRFIEDDLVTESGYRNSYSVTDAVQRGAITTPELGTLVNRHLLRREHHLGTDRVELTHDLLTTAVVEERDRRRSLERAARERRHRLKFGSVAAGFALIAIVFGVLAINASLAREVAEHSQMQAVLGASQAERQRIEANAARDEARLALGGRENAVKMAEAQADVALHQRNIADAERNRSRSREFAAHAKATMNEDPELAIALGLRGMQYADTAEARSALIDAARYAWPYATLSPSDLGGDPRALALNADGSRLVVLAGANAISVWDVTLRHPARLWLKDATAATEAGGALDPPASVAFSPDSRAIAVGRRMGVDLLDASRGQAGTSLRQLSNDVEDRRLVFSPDGRWLASSQRSQTELLLVEYTTPGAQPVRIVAPLGHNIGGFAVLPDGKAIVTVGGNPLVAYLFERDRGWGGRKLDLTSCITPASVSPGSEYVSATWRMSACSTLLGDRRTSIPTDSKDGVADDIVWSPGGAAFVEYLRTSPKTFDLVVGRRNQSGRLESRIKGTHPLSESEKSQFVSVSEAGTRMALIDVDQNHTRVRVYSVAGSKPFLSRFAGAFAVSPNGRWISLARPQADGGEQKVAIDVIPIEKAFTRDRAFHSDAPISVERPPSQLYASSDSLVVVFDGEAPQTVVFDVLTRERRYESLTGIWQPLDAAGEMLLFTQRGRLLRVVRTRDGAPIARWESSPGVDELLGVRVSTAGRALAVFRRNPPRTGAITAALYSIRGTNLVPAGQVTNLSLPLSRVLVAEDARSLSSGTRVWHVTKGASAVRPALADVRSRSLARSTGGFEIRSAIATSPNIQFSADQRWLAAWDIGVLRVFDLSLGEAAFRLEVPVNTVRFAGDGMLHVQLSDNTSMLIPLEWAVMERFLKWLTPRTLTAHEECVYGLRDKDCWTGRVRTGASSANASARQLPRRGGDR